MCVHNKRNWGKVIKDVKLKLNGRMTTPLPSPMTLTLVHIFFLLLLSLDVSRSDNVTDLVDSPGSNRGKKICKLKEFRQWLACHSCDQWKVFYLKALDTIG